MRIAHASDLHYCTEHMEWVDRAFGFAVQDAIRRECDVFIDSGDSFHRQVGLHERPAHAFLSRMVEAANAMPCLVLQGTQSHDHPGTLDALKTIGGHYPVYVADRICQVALVGNQWVESEGPLFTDIPDGTRLLVSALPSINKGEIAASVGADNAASAAGELIHELCAAWSSVNKQANAMDIPTVMVTHGTVSGALTESSYAMISQDHEFTAGTLFAAGTRAVMIGHIHAHNVFRNDDEHQIIAYPGSITRLIHGHHDPTGYLVWRIDSEGTTFDFVETPAKRLLEVSFTGPPDMDDIRKLAKDANGAHVRVRYQVDEEYRHSVDHDEIRQILKDAENIKIEPRVIPITRSRSEGISLAPTIQDKLKMWAETSETDTGPLLERFDLLQTIQDPADIVKQINNDGEVV